jgi:transcriptional repressor NrdR
MKCPHCQHDESKVIDSRSIQSGNNTRRRRECLICNYRFTTYEYIQSNPILVIKKSGVRENYNRAKLEKSFHLACNKRSVSEETIDNAIKSIENKINNLSNVEVDAIEVGELVMDELKQIDKVAFIRYASVYLDFKEPDDFKTKIDELSNLKVSNK